jgi:mono/diheme cytochrome c family protein
MYNHPDIEVNQSSSEPPALIGIALTILVLACQAGDRKGEAQPPLPPHIKIPPAPVLPPEEAIKTIKVPPGFRVELVASEPLVFEPVAMAFDPDGRLWVVEMRSYMLDVDGRGETLPMSDVAVLEDTDGDGKFDKRTVFLDKLVLPRAISIVGDGVLIAEPPSVWHCRSATGTLVCDQKTLVTATYCNRAVIEHTANGLFPAMDNWIYSANSTMRFRRDGDKWIIGTTRSRGQWGMTQDDFGRLFYNSNPEMLRGDLLPCYSPLAHSGKGPGVSIQISKDQLVWPARVNPGVNRGYQKGILRENGRIAACTAACGPVIYRGDNFPAEFRGNAFICDPACNIIQRRILKEESGTITSVNPDANGVDFIASTDERFRPVNCYVGPDGCLYFIDFYRGIVQHRLYLTTYLRNQVLSRELDKGLGLGRIYRVVHESKPPGPPPRLSRAPSSELVRALSHQNGWWRDTAQRLLVERKDPSCVGDLRKLAVSSGDPIPRLHAMFALEGMGQLDPPTLQVLLAEKNPKLAAAAAAVKEGAGPVAALLPIATVNANLKDAELATIAGKEVDFIERIMAMEAWEKEQPDREALLRKLASKIMAEARPERVEDLLELAAFQATSSHWRRRAIVAGMAEVRQAKTVALPVRSAALVKLSFSDDDQVRAPAAALLAAITWPGKAEREPEPARAAPLTAAEQARWERGRKQFTVSCAVCHSLSGLGEEGKGPPLVDSEWVLGSEQRLGRIIMNGLHGPIRVNGKLYESVEMPAILTMSNDEIAEALTYIRREWGHQAPPVEPAAVRSIRAKVDDREEPWSMKELLEVP